MICCNRLPGVAGLIVLVCGCADMAIEMSKGQMLYRAKCSSCHSVIARSRYGQERWRLYVDKYGRKITSEEKQTILQYLEGGNSPVLGNPKVLDKWLDSYDYIVCRAEAKKKTPSHFLCPTFSGGEKVLFLLIATLPINNGSGLSGSNCQYA